MKILEQISTPDLELLLEGLTLKTETDPDQLLVLIKYGAHPNTIADFNKKMERTSQLIEAFENELKRRKI